MAQYYLHLACLIFLACMVIITALITWQDRKRYLMEWLLYQLWFFMSGIFLFIYLFISPLPVFNIAYQLCLIISGWTLLSGTCQLFKKKLPRYLKIIFLLVIAWLIGSNIFNESNLLANLPGPLLVCYCYLVTGWLLLQEKSIPGFGRLITGFAFILWGLHVLDRPFFYHIAWLRAYAYSIAMVMGVFAGFGLVIYYFDLSRAAIIRREKQFRMLADNARDVIFHYHFGEHPGFEYVSPSSTLLYGYTPDEHYAQPDLWCHIFDKSEHEKLKGYLRAPETMPSSLELKVQTRSGDIVWLEQSNVIIRGTDQQVIAIEGIMRDITKRKIMEEQLRHLSLHDALTGVYNRSYLEMKLLEADKTSGGKGGIIIGDVDGLKLVNDALGHIIGDQLLRTAARVLSLQVRGEETIARIGGDEFAILLPAADEARIIDFINDTYEAIDDYNQQNDKMPLSISLGYALNRKGQLTFTELMQQADHNMYREKLRRGRTIRNTLVKVMADTMAARDFEGHAERMEDLICKLGKQAGLTESSWGNLRLFARFHDLGKVGIPDRVLYKADPLSLLEREEIERHCEIGFRLAQSSPELSHIAEWILKHHEWWNGQGYPLGLAGEDIPIECRVLAIVDAYDAMISDRPYRGALSVDAALDEIEGGSGTQFDPDLVPLFIGLVINDQQLNGTNDDIND